MGVIHITHGQNDDNPTSIKWKAMEPVDFHGELPSLEVVDTLRFLHLHQILLIHLATLL